MQVFSAAHSRLAPARAARQRALDRCRLAAIPPAHLPARPHEDRKAGVVPRGLVRKVTGEELEVAIAERTTPVIVDFFATWCGPCLILAQELEKVAADLGEQVTILKIDVDENPDLATMLKIEGLPTVVFIPKDQSKPALRTEGLLPADRIKQICAENL